MLPDGKVEPTTDGRIGCPPEPVWLRGTRQQQQALRQSRRFLLARVRQQSGDVGITSRNHDRGRRHPPLRLLEGLPRGVPFEYDLEAPLVGSSKGAENLQ
jgi:hypothetical protein